MKKLVIIADWANGSSLENQEVRSAVEGYLRDSFGVNINYVFSTPSTVHTGFLLDQVVRTEERYGRPLETVIFQNTDPRLFDEENIANAVGATPLIIKLKSGLYLVGPNAGYDFSFIKPKIDLVYEYTGINIHGQFHSRDLYARIAAHLMDALEDDMDLEEVSTNLIPPLENYYVGHIDIYGNIKTSVTHEYLKGKYEYGDEVKVKINDVEKKVKYVSNLFGGKVGELVIYPGSSGQYDNPYMEITAWQHFTKKNSITGQSAFNTAQPGDIVEIL